MSAKEKELVKRGVPRSGPAQLTLYPGSYCRLQPILHHAPLIPAGMNPFHWNPQESTGMGRNPQEWNRNGTGMDRNGQEWTGMAQEWTKMYILELRV